MAVAGALHGPACLSRCSQPATSGPGRPLWLRHAPHASARGAWSRADVRCSVTRAVIAVADLADLGILDEDEEDTSRRRRGRGRGDRDRDEREPRGEGGKEEKEFEERVVQVSRVTKVVKGGKQMSFRAVVVVGDEKGKVGVGCAAAKEVIDAVAKAVLDAKKHFVSVPLTRSFSFPHRIDGIAGAAKVMLRPASEGTGVIAGGSVRVVLELAGVKNAFGKQLGSGNALNNARATIDGLRRQRTMQMVAAERGLTMEELVGYQQPERKVENPSAPAAEEPPAEEGALPLPVPA